MVRDENPAYRLQRLLLERGLATEEKVQQCIAESQQNQKSFIEVLYRSSGVSERDLIALLGEIFGYATVNISIITIAPEILSLVPKEIVKKHHVLPLSRLENTLTVALVDPTNLSALDDLRAISGLRMKPVLATFSQLEQGLKKYYGSSAGGAPEYPIESLEQILQEVRSENMNLTFKKDAHDAADLLEEAKATPIIQLVNHLLIEAIRRKASDVFIEPWEKTMRVRYRIDGALEEIINTPRHSVAAVLSRIKVMSKLNIAEHRIPQDGRIRVRILGREVDLRVSILPTCYGEKACLRILDSNSQTQNLETLGFGDKDLVMIRRNAEKPHGMILVTGPTGSGKTTTLYSILQHLDSPEKNITTVEDPVEYQARGINQVNIREQVGLTFPAALRSILRQDPDIILIGEIRDLTTMDIAIKAALTGHLVLSTLHTNDSTSAIVRMVNMGIEPFLIASSVLMISAQRLVRKLCTHCRVPDVPEPELLKTLNLSKQGKPTFYHPQGCRQCRSSGFSGRTVIAELFELKAPLTELIVRGGSGEELRELAREKGMRTLRENGIEKVVSGLTSIEEVLRVTSPEPILQVQGV